MKKTSFFILLISVLYSTKNFAQTESHPYETIMDGKTKILKGFLQRSDIESDTSFAWFKQNYNLGRADMPAVAAFQKNAAKFRVIIFFGTWCEDSENLLPVFFRLVDKSGFPETNITLLGLDRAKNTSGDLSAVFQITHTPTFIVMSDGKEVGRVVEYGKYGQIDKELGEIVAGL